MPRTSKDYYIFGQCKKGEKYYFKARVYDSNGASSAWSNLVGKVAGDYNGPSGITTSHIESVETGKSVYTVKIKDNWDEPADLKEIRWYKIRRAIGDPQSVWQASYLTYPYLGTDRRGSYTINGEANQKYTYDVFAVPFDLAGNYPASIIPCVVAGKPSTISYAIDGFEIDLGAGYVPHDPAVWVNTASVTRFIKVGEKPVDFEKMAEKLFTENCFHSSLRTHKLKGELKDQWSFSIDYHWRIVFVLEDDKAVFTTIGTHKVYR